MDEKNKKVSLTQYFQAVDRRLERKGLYPRFGFKVRICGQLIELRLPTEELEQVARLSVSGFITEEEGKPNAIFLYWYDRCDDYLPKGEAEFSSVWKSRDETGNLKIGTDDDSLVGCDLVRQRYYFARALPKKDPHLTCRHIMVNAFARWAKYNGMFLLHAAAVGYAGAGVLIAGRGGRGKSTFAVSCLTCGLDFVSDDYTLLTAEGPTRAMPLYSTVGIRTDMLEKFPQLGEPSDNVPGKPLFEIPADRFCRSLEIKAIILPLVAGDDDPRIEKIPNGTAMAQLIHSTITQTESRHDSALVVAMSRRLGSLPVYEMRMSSDLEKNPAFLRDFIQRTL